MSAEVIEGVGDVVDVADEIAAEMTAAAACYQEVGVVIKAILNLPFIVNSLWKLDTVLLPSALSEGS